ncbi:Fe(2+) transporter permease subunit FeoB [Candidiatus Paracoxiella cheracis]|uniref:Fe(2+) transporter permease subunit FeoB n=1 Tax=Candidiatus Paracoxiella cheracis TaxID=3405120 RepID=UPI003BF503E0
MNKAITIALAGNPNSGKTALFNALTGSHQRVGNWPGVTVDKKTGHFQHQGQRVAVVDLPGTYSTSVVSEHGALDEKIACEYLSFGEADVIVNIIDAANLERNLYLTLQLLELQIPMVLAVNMMDVIKQRGIDLNLKRLSKLLGCPVVGIVAKQGKGVDELKTQIIKTAEPNQASNYTLSLPNEINESVQVVTQLIHSKNAEKNRSWIALRLLEGDQFAAAQVEKNIVDVAQEQAQQIELKLNEEPDILIADARYAAASQIAQKIMKFITTRRQTITQWIDRIVLNRYLGIPIFLGVMYLMFLFAINIGGAFQDFFDISSTTIFVDGLAHLLTSWHVPIWLTAVLANGIGKGINTTITFIPVIGGMFLFLAFLEDSGYMARAAFVMDRFMRAVGLPGKSFVPMIVGFGCNVPAVMGARTLENRRDRILTILMMPFMSCGARLAIFAVFASAFFPTGGATIIFILYLTGVLVAVGSGFVMRKTLLKGKPAPLVMELPPYHVPRLGALNRQAWFRLKSFLTRASKVIIPVCVIIGALNAVTVTGKLVHDNDQHSLLSEVGRIVTPVFHPMGIHQNNWPATVGLTTGVLAKEVVVGTLNTLYSEAGHLTQQEADQFNFWDGLKAAVVSVPQNLSQLGDAFKNPVAAGEAPHDMNKTAYGVMFQRFGGKAAAFSYLLFVLLYFPCVSTMAAMRREVGRGWALFSVLWSTGLAYSLSVMCYQLLTIALHPVSSSIWVGSLLATLGLAVIGLRRYAKGDPEKKKSALEEIKVITEFARDKATLRGH